MRSGAGATVAKTGRRDLLVAWISHHQRVCLSTLAELLGNPFASLMTWLVIGIALALPSILYVMLNNISDVSADLSGKPRVSLYLQTEVTLSAGRRLADEIVTTRAVEAVSFISSETALKDFQQRSGFGDVLNSLDKNPLPHVIEVVLETMEPIALTDLVAAWENTRSIARVRIDVVSWVYSDME